MCKYQFLNKKHYKYNEKNSIHVYSVFITLYSELIFLFINTKFSRNSI